MTDVLIRQRHTKRTACEDGDRNWSDASTKQGTHGFLAVIRR